MKDNLTARKDLKFICNRPELEVDERRPNVMPKAIYTLTRKQKRRMCEWITRLKFPDGYASNLVRCVDVKELRLHDMKSHDCHIFMQNLIPIVVHEMLPKSVWSALTEVSLLFQIICWTTLDLVKVQELEDKVATILCNFEKIFPSSFLDSKENLSVHLPYEARMGGPIQYMWIYPFERSSYTDTNGDFYWILEEVIQLDYPLIPNMQIVLFKCRWVDPVRVAFQEDEPIPTPQVLTDDHNYALHEPNGIQLVADLNQQEAGTSRAANGESGDEPDEDSFDEDYKTEIDNYD
ncbi:UNVERIFIED_CONTAM: hypothetical protein Sradi_4020200 [Sesamum radiatum]|uniref:DUF4218 domain-containing protein n=1 Tax=Sesamum radiatum TaxID=300843 RepID=A0AAW2PKY2_SESRA